MSGAPPARANEFGEQRIAALLERNSVAIAEIDLNGRFTLHNEAFCRLVGRTREALESVTAREITHPDDRGLCGEAVAGVAEQRTSEATLEKRFVLPDGTSTWTRLTIAPVRDADGNVARMLLIAENIDARKRAESALRASEERLRLATSAVSLGIRDWDLATGVVHATPEERALLGLPQENSQPFHDAWLAALHPDDRPQVVSGLDGLVRNGTCWNGEYRVLWPDGSIHHISTLATVYRDAAGRAVRLIAVDSDVTAARQAEAALRASEERYRALVCAARSLVWHADPGGNINESVARELELHFGISGQQVRPDAWITLVHPEDFPRAQEWQADLRSHPAEFRWRLRLRDPRQNEWRYVEITGTPIRDQAGHLREWAGTMTDIHAQHTAGIQLRESEATLRAVYESAPAMMGVVEVAQDDILHVFDNAAACRYFGTEPGGTAGKYTVRDLASSRDAAATWIGHCQKAARDGAPVRFEFDQDGRWFSASVAPIGSDPASRRFCYVVQDVTESRQASAALERQEEWLRLALEAGSMGVWSFDLDRDEYEASPEALAMLGFPPGSRPTTGSVLDVVIPEDRAAVAEARRQAISTKGGSSVEFRVRRDGELRWLFSRGHGTPGTRRLTGVLHDITPRKLAELQFKDSQARLNAALAASNTGTYVIDVANGTIRQDENLRRMTGADPMHTSAPADELFRFVHPDDAAAVRATIERTKTSGDSYFMVYRLRQAAGGYLWVADRGALERDVSGRPTYIVGACTDVSDLKRTEDALRESEQQYRVLANLMPQIVFISDPEGRIEFVNERVTENCGESSNPLGFGWFNLLHPDDAARLHKRWRPAPAGYHLVERELRIRMTDGEYRWHLVRAQAQLGSSGEAVRWIGTATDVHARKLAEDAVRISEQRFRAALSGSPVTVFHHDCDLRYTWVCNPIYGRAEEEFLGHTDAELEPALGPPLMRIKRAVLESGDPAAGEITLDSADPPQTFLYRLEPLRDDEGQITGLSGAAINISEQRRLELRLHDAQKLESLGVLAGGVAHDFNNLLTAIIGNISLARASLPEGSNLARTLDAAEAAAERAAALTNQMLAYSGKGHFVLQKIDLSSLLDRLAGLIRPTLSKRVILHLELERGLSPVEADVTQLQQLAMNLITNAVEALGEGTGMVTVRTSEETLLQPAHSLLAGTYVRLDVADTGAGMDQTTLSRIFDPFFTTKFTGRGLGLAAVQGIVRGHRGSIEVTSHPGKGSTFVVRLPAVATERVRPAEIVESGQAPGPATILVVDDEEDVLAVARSALENYGYTVLTATSGPSAMAVLAAAPDSVSAVLLDLSMPGMGGDETLPVLRAISPGLPVVVTSGFAERDTIERFAGQAIQGFLQKPYSPPSLARSIRKAIESGPESAPPRRPL